MAITYRGSICTNYMMPGDGNYCFVLENTARSRVTLSILRCVIQFDTLVLSTVAGAIMPLVKGLKGTATATGGLVMSAKSAFDTALNAPDPGVIVRIDPGFMGTESSNIVITGTLYNLGQEFTERLLTGVEQQYTYDATLLDPLPSGPILVKPGEMVAIRWVEGTNAVSGTAFIEIVWEEDQTDAGYTVSGTVSLGGSPVTGAKVAIITGTDIDLANPELEIITTGAPGTYSKTLASGIKAAVHVQHRSGATKYNDRGLPYLEKP